MLRTGLSFCITSGEPVFLDTLADRYFCLAQGEQAAFLALLADPASDSARNKLATIGLLAPDNMRDTPISLMPAAAPAISASLLEQPMPPLHLGALARAGFHRARVGAELRRSGLGKALNRLTERKRNRSGSGHGLDDCVRSTHAHEALALLTASLDQCLPRSLALAHHLLDRGHAADLIFAVHLRPFKAHCWVQLGDILINDRRDTVAPFTPILVL